MNVLIFGATGMASFQQPDSPGAIIVDCVTWIARSQPLTFICAPAQDSGVYTGGATVAA